MLDPVGAEFPRVRLKLPMERTRRSPPRLTWRGLQVESAQAVVGGPAGLRTLLQAQAVQLQHKEKVRSASWREREAGVQWLAGKRRKR